MFDKVVFEAGFLRAIRHLGKAEKMTKELLRSLSRNVLEAHHASADVSYINRLIEVLTPINRQVVVKYFQHFSGFHYDDGLLRFTKKSKKTYEECAALSIAFLEDPLNNVWTWAARNISVEKVEKPFLEKVASTIEKLMAQAKKEAVPQADMMKAMVKGGITVEAIIAMLEGMDDDKDTLVSKVAGGLGFDVNAE